jgi:hypothetical protein
MRWLHEKFWDDAAAFETFMNVFERLAAFVVKKGFLEILPGGESIFRRIRFFVIVERFERHPFFELFQQDLSLTDLVFGDETCTILNAPIVTG